MEIRDLQLYYSILREIFSEEYFKLTYLYTMEDSVELFALENNYEILYIKIRLDDYNVLSLTITESIYEHSFDNKMIEIRERLEIGKDDMSFSLELLQQIANIKVKILNKLIDYFKCNYTFENQIKNKDKFSQLKQYLSSLYNKESVELLLDAESTLVHFTSIDNLVKIKLYFFVLEDLLMELNIDIDDDTDFALVKYKLNKIDPLGEYSIDYSFRELYDLRKIDKLNIHEELDALLNYNNRAINKEVDNLKWE